MTPPNMKEMDPTRYVKSTSQRPGSAAGIEPDAAANRNRNPPTKLQRLSQCSSEQQSKPLWRWFCVHSRRPPAVKRMEPTTAQGQ